MTALKNQNNNMPQLPGIDKVSAEVHKAWMESKKANGVSSRKSKDGEELMVPHEELTEKSKRP